MRYLPICLLLAVACVPETPAVCTKHEECHETYYCDIEREVCLEGARPDAGQPAGSSSSASSTGSGGSSGAISFSSSAATSGTSSSSSTGGSSSSPVFQPGLVFFSAPSRTVTEGGGAVGIEVNITAAPSVPVVVPVMLTGSAAPGDDFTVTSAMVRIEATSTVGFLQLAIVDDAVAEFEETIIITLGEPANAALGSQTTHTVTIPGNDDDVSYPEPEVVAPAEGEVITGRTAQYWGWCEFGSTLTITYGLAGEGFVASSGAVNPASVPCEMCDVMEHAECGTAPNTRGRFEFEVGFEGPGDARTVMVQQRDPEGNASNTSRNVLLAPSQIAYLKGDPVHEDRGLSAAAVSGGTLAIGAAGAIAPQLDGGVGTARTGAVLMFNREDGGWQSEGQLWPLVAGDWDGFGTSVAIWGDTLVVGAPSESSGAGGIDGDPFDNSMWLSGAAYLFTSTPAGWTQSHYIKAPVPLGSMRFGSSVAISQRFLAISAPTEPYTPPGVDAGNGSGWPRGAVYVYEWTPSLRYIGRVESETYEIETGFGWHIALLGDLLIVGAPYDSGDNSGIDSTPTAFTSPRSGAVYLFRITADSVAREHSLKAPLNHSCEFFGWRFAAQGNTLVVGAPGAEGGEDGCEEQQDSRGAYSYVRTGGAWAYAGVIAPGSLSSPTHFGSAVSFHGSRLLVGDSFNEDALGGVNADGGAQGIQRAGAAYLFREYTPGSFRLIARLKPRWPHARDHFGAVSALSDVSAIVLAPEEGSASTGVNGDELDSTVRGAGAAFVFE